MKLNATIKIKYDFSRPGKLWHIRLTILKDGAKVELQAFRGKSAGMIALVAGYAKKVWEASQKEAGEI